MIEIRPARLADDAVLTAVDEATWDLGGSPAPLPPADRPFFHDRAEPGDVLVAELDGAVVGYVAVGTARRLPSHEHVAEVRGLAVAPAAMRRGVGRALMDAALARAGERDARKVTLRVLGPNTAARRLYESCGFVVEGVLREEFRLDGRFVDDVLMARFLAR